MQATDPVRDELADLAGRVEPLLPAASLAGRRLRMLLAGRTRRRQARAALDELHGLVAASGIDRADPRWRRALGLRPDVPEIDGSIWDDFRERAVAYNGLLVAIANLDGEPEAAHGHIPSDIAERIDTHELDTSLLDVSLRGYQAFGARFALVQRPGDPRRRDGPGQDDRGPGRHRSPPRRRRHPLPGRLPGQRAGQLGHEIERHSRLRAFRLHGAGPGRNLRRLGARTAASA